MAEASFTITVNVVEDGIIEVDGAMTYTLQVPANPGDELELVPSGSGQLSYSCVAVGTGKRRVIAEIDLAPFPQGFQLDLSVINLTGGGEMGSVQAPLVFTYGSTAYGVLIDGIGNAWASGDLSAVLTYIDPMAELSSPINIVLKITLTDPNY